MPKHEWDPEEAAYYAEMDEDEFYGADPTLCDLEQWARYTHWTADEATALSFNKNPDIVYAAFLKDKPHEFSEDYLLRLKWLQRAIDDGSLSRMPSPQALVSWMDNADLRVESDLFNAIRNKTEIKAAPKRKGDMTRGQNTDLKLILSMAIKHYGFRQPTDAKTADAMAASAATKMAKDLAIPVTATTISGRLKTAFEDHSEKIKWPKNAN